MTNDLLLSLDKTKSTFYFVVDLSAAFDTLAHDLILSILEIGFQRGWGFKDKVLSFLYSYLSSKCQKLLIDGEFSMPRTIKTGARRGYLLCRVLFSCYSFPLEVLFERHDVNYRFYADDTLFCLLRFDKSGGF